MDSKMAREAEIERLVRAWGGCKRHMQQRALRACRGQRGKAAFVCDSACKVVRHAHARPACAPMPPTQAEVEMQLIERLKQKQMRQRKAYQQLEAVLALGTRCAAPFPLLACGARADGVRCCWLVGSILSWVTGYWLLGMLARTARLCVRHGPPANAACPPPRLPCSQRKSVSVSSTPQPQLMPQEPTEEDVARAFSVYDAGATGEIPTSSLDGAPRAPVRVEGRCVHIEARAPLCVCMAVPIRTTTMLTQACRLCCTLQA